MSLTRMSTLLIFIFFLNVREGYTKDKCEDQEACNKCIQESGCIWCSEPFNRDESKCRLETNDKNATSKWCPSEKLVMPELNVTTLQDDVFNDGKNGDAVQLKPQKVKLVLRKGQEYNLSFQYSKAANYPVDLYYLMDMSDSMKVHKNVVANLGNKLVKLMKNITTDFRLGFGSFVDKVAYPFVNTHKAKIDRPCEHCIRAYSYKNHLSLTSDAKMFSREVTSAKLSRNIDHPEGGFDAIIQAIVCKEEIGWREAARHLLIFSTDADPHIAGDGRLVGAMQPNDGKCHLKNNLYTKALLYDYPSASFVNYIAKENNINLIFAIAGRTSIYNKYEKFVKHEIFENSKIGRLNENSTNIIDMVLDNYNKIVSSVRITHKASKSVEIKYESSCNQGDSCTNIRVGDVLNFTATIKPTDCKSEVIQIKPEGVGESLFLELEVICECECEKPGHKDYHVKSGNCSGQGTKACGICLCDPTFFGTLCECNQETATTSDPNVCMQDNSTVCSNNGICKCGKCICDKYTYGKYCECSDFTCKRLKGSLCSGEDHGKCECGQCKCLKGWKGEDCGCLDNEDLCISSNGDRQICSGHGECICGKCVCKKDENKYSGVYCEECWNCEGQRCKELSPCVECQVFKTGKYNQAKCKANCEKFKTTVVDKISENNDNTNIKTCAIFDDVNCTVVFQYQYDDENQLIVEAEREKRCFEALDLFIIGLSILGSVIVIGLITLIIWKIFTSIHDKIEYDKFEKERMESKWHNSDNPLYVGASRTFYNPTYRT